MKIYAISDPHLSLAMSKPMDKFGPEWEGHWEKLAEAWRGIIGAEDAVLVPGDISWAMSLADALPDLEALGALPGIKVLLRGNHDYWWGSVSRVRDKAPEKMLFLQNDAVRLGNTVICGSRGWLSPFSDGFTAEDRKIYDRELIRLEMSLKAGEKLLAPGDSLIAMTHYPPVYPDKRPTEAGGLLERYKAEQAVFGHIHSVKGGWEPFSLNGVKYMLVSCDYIGFCPVLIQQ